MLIRLAPFLWRGRHRGLPAVRGALQLGADLIWERLVLLCPELRPKTTARWNMITVWKAFWSGERFSVLEFGVVWSWVLLGAKDVLSWWQTGSSTKSWFQPGPACWLWLSLPPFADALSFFFFPTLNSLNLESFRKCVLWECLSSERRRSPQGWRGALTPAKLRADKTNQPELTLCKQTTGVLNNHSCQFVWCNFEAGLALSRGWYQLTHTGPSSFNYSRILRFFFLPMFWGHACSSVAEIL